MDVPYLTRGLSLRHPTLVTCAHDVSSTFLELALPEGLLTIFLFPPTIQSRSHNPLRSEMSDVGRGLPLLSGPPPPLETPNAESACRKCNKEFNVIFARARKCNHCGMLNRGWYDRLIDLSIPPCRILLLP